MKKIILIIFLVIFNILLIYSKVSGKNDINLKLDDDELAIVVIDNPLSKALLLIKNNKTILYILEDNNDKKLLNDLEKFTSNYDYIYKKDGVETVFDQSEIIKKSIIDDIYISESEIRYMNYAFCINESYCDFTYLTKDIDIKDSNNIIYTGNVSEDIIDKKKQEWVDLYKVSKNNYLIIFIKDDNYEITNLIR